MVGFIVYRSYLHRKWSDLSVRCHIWTESGREFRLEATSLWAKRGPIYCLEAISWPKMAGFIVQELYLFRKWMDLPYLARKWPDITFRWYVWIESGRIYRLDTISGPKVGGFAVSGHIWAESGRIYRLEVIYDMRIYRSKFTSGQRLIRFII